MSKLIANSRKQDSGILSQEPAEFNVSGLPVSEDRTSRAEISVDAVRLRGVKWRLHRNRKEKRLTGWNARCIATDETK